MALHAEAKRANVEGSVRHYVVSNLSATFTSGDAIDLGGGEKFDDTLYAEWLQVRLLEQAAPRGMESPRLREGHYGRELWHLLNLNIFVRPGKLTTFNSLRLQTLRDTVLAFFTPGTRVAVKDYAGDSQTLGYLYCERADRDGPVADPQRENELLQWQLLIAMRWSETWS